MGNKSNRQVAKLDIRTLSTMKPFLFFETANTVGLELSGDAVYARAAGANRISHDDPWDGNFTVEAQIFPLEYLALLSDGTISDSCVDAVKETIECATAGQLTVPSGIKAGTLFVFASGEFGGTAIAGSLSGTTFTATETTDLAVDTEYEVGYLITKSTGVRKVSFSNSKAPKDYFVTLLTNDKDEEGVITAKKYVIYKAKPNRNFSVSHSSDGDPMSVSIRFTALEDKDGNFVDVIEVE